MRTIIVFINEILQNVKRIIEFIIEMLQKFMRIIVEMLQKFKRIIVEMLMRWINGLEQMLQENVFIVIMRLLNALIKTTFFFGKTETNEKFNQFYFT